MLETRAKALQLWDGMKSGCETRAKARLGTQVHKMCGYIAMNINGGKQLCN